MKKSLKKGLALLLAICLTVPAVSSMSGSVNTVHAASSGDAAENSVTGVKYVYYENISQYRGEKSGERYTKYPMKEGFVFAGWYDKDAFTAGETSATDKDKTTIETTAISGAAWAKFVPEEVLSVKAQNSSAIADKPESVKLRLVTTVDSNRYSEVGFQIKYNQGNKVYTYSSNEVFSKLTAYEKGDRPFVYQPRVFHEASSYFMAYTILDVNHSRFDNFEFHVTPYWITNDGTLVTGIVRERLLASDDRSSDEDGTAPRFFVKNTENTFDTVDSNLGTISVTTTETDTAVHAIYFVADESDSESSYWRVTGKYSATGGGVGFSIKSGDHMEGYTFGGGTTVHVNQQWGYPNEGTEWNDYTDSTGEYITEYNTGLNAWNTATDVPFCAEIKDDVLTLWVNGNKAWNLPLTDDRFGGFEAGSTYSFGFHNIDKNHTITWSDIKVETEDSVWDFSDEKTYQLPEVDTDAADFNRFYVKSGEENFNTVDSSVGTISVTTAETDEAVHAIYFGADESGLESSYWKITGKYSATGGGVGFSIKSGDHLEGYTFGGGTTINVNQSWDSPHVNRWNTYEDTTGEYITSYNAELNAWNTATDVPFCAEIKDDVLTLWVNGNKAWNLPLTDDRFGGFGAGSTYSFGFHNIDPNQTITWSGLMVETTEDTRFSIKEKTDGVTVYEQNGIIVSESGANILAKSYLSADTANGESDYWNVTGKYNANQGMKGFSIKSGDHEEGYTITGETSICLNQSWNYPNATYEVTGDGWNVYNDTTGEYITSYNAELGGYQGANGIQFRAEIKNDVFTVWVNDNKAWELPLTDERFGGFKAGSTYSLGFHNIDADCIAKWTNLVVSTEAPAYTVDYTYNIGTNERNSYRYISGASDTVYAAGIYTKKSSNDVFGLAIRNGGQERQVFFDGHGVRIVNADGEVSNYTTPIINDNGAYVWYQDMIDGTSAVADMLAQESGDIQIAWAIENNYLYCDINEATAFRIPMTSLCADWKDGRYYQVGIAACGENSEGLKFKLTDWAFGKDVYTNRYMAAETDELQVNGMVYNPIGKGAYVSTHEENQVVYAHTKTYTNASESIMPVAIEATLDWKDTDKENKWDNTTVGVTVVLDGNNEKSVQFDIVSDEYVRLNSGYSGWNYRGSDNSLWMKGDGNDLIKAPISSDMKIQAAVYDHVFYIMFNGVTAYECALTDLFGGVVGANSLYDGTQKVDIGIVSAYNDRRTPKFKDVNVYEGQAAVEMKTKEWDFYPTERGGDGLTGSYDVAAGTITNDNYYSVDFGVPSTSWEITGRWHSPVADTNTWNLVGFVITDESGNCLRIMANNNCIQWDTGGTGWAAPNYNSDSNYVKNGSIFTDNFLQKMGTLEFKMRLVNDQMDIYLDNTLCYTIPLQELNANLEKGRYKVATAGWDGDNQWQNVKVKKGCEVTGEYSTFAEQVLATTELAAIKIRDPYILTDESKGYYYMYGTDTAGFSANDGGVPVYRSKNMQNWERLAPCYIADLTKYTQYSLWAPEVIKHNDSYYMTLTVLEQGEVAADAELNMTYSNPAVRKTIILKSDRPTGGFEIIADNVTLPGHDCLDGTLYFEGETPYLIYSHEWCCNACFGATDEAAASNTERMGHMNYVKLKDDLSEVADDGEHVKWCTASDYVVEDANASIWDQIFGTVETNAACVVDGPQVYEKDGQKYLLWSTGTASAEAIDSTYYAQLYVPFDSLNGGVELKNSQTLYTGDDSNTAFANTTGGGHGMIFCGISTKDEKYVLHAPNVSTDTLFEHAIIFDVEFNNETKTITKK